MTKSTVQGAKLRIQPPPTHVLLGDPKAIEAAKREVTEHGEPA